MASLIDRLDAGKLTLGKNKQIHERITLTELRQLYDKLLGQLEEGQKNLEALKSFLYRFQKEFKLHLKNYREPVSPLKNSVLPKSILTNKYDRRVSKDDTEVGLTRENRPTDAEKIQNLSRSLSFIPEVQFEHPKEEKDVKHQQTQSKETTQPVNPSVLKPDIGKIFAKHISRTPEMRISSESVPSRAVKAFTKLRGSKQESETQAPKSSLAGSSLSVKVIEEEASKKKSTMRSSNPSGLERTRKPSSQIKDHSDRKLRGSRQSLVFGSDRERRKVISLRTFYLNKKAQNGDKNNVELTERISKIINDTEEITEKKEVSLSDDIGSVTSSIGESIIEEIQEEIFDKIKLGGEASSTLNGLNLQKVKPSFIPIKISFYIGNQTLKNTPGLHATNERIYRDFDIREMHWHLKDTAIVGLQLYLYNRKEKYYLQGRLHGIEGNRINSFILKPWETFTKLEFISNPSEILTIKLTTNLARTFKTGKNKSALEKEGRRFLSRYFPKEVTLCKFFSAFDPSTERLLNIRFMYVRTVFY